MNYVIQLSHTQVQEENSSQGQYAYMVTSKTSLALTHLVAEQGPLDSFTVEFWLKVLHGSGNLLQLSKNVQLSVEVLQETSQVQVTLEDLKSQKTSSIKLP